MSRNFSKCQSLPQISVNSQRAAFPNNKATMGGIILALTAGPPFLLGLLFINLVWYPNT